jgi:hypothetical protein
LQPLANDAGALLPVARPILRENIIGDIVALDVHATNLKV